MHSLDYLQGAAADNTAIKGDMMDLFCGSGGASEATQIGGLSVAVAVDNKECAVRSHQHNHPLQPSNIEPQRTKAQHKAFGDAPKVSQDLPHIGPFVPTQLQAFNDFVVPR